jgi:hypothetical protein
MKCGVVGQISTPFLPPTSTNVAAVVEYSPETGASTKNVANYVLYIRQDAEQVDIL